MIGTIHCRTPAFKPSNPPAQFQRHCQTQAAASSTRLAPLQITYTTNFQEIDVDELADLMSRCATYAPGHATHEAECRCDPSTGSPADPARFKRRLRRALNNSLVCVAAYAAEASLPSHLHRSVRGLSPDQNATNAPVLGDIWKLAPGILPVLGPKVLVGFARAVGDASLVATIHDVAVVPEVRGQRLGVTLVQKVTQQLYMRDIVDVGTVIREDLEPFLLACNFGEDTEKSVSMALSEEGAMQWTNQGEVMIEQILTKERRQKKVS